MSIPLEVFLRFSQFSIIIPLIISGRKDSLLSKEQKLIKYLVLLSFISEVIATAIAKLAENPNNWIVYHVFAVVMFIIISQIYRSLLKQNYPIWLFNLVISAFAMFAIFNSLVLQPVDSVNSNVIVMSNLLFILYSLAYFKLLLKYSDRQDFKSNPMFWLNSGILLYNSGALTLFLLINNLMSISPDLVITSWVLNGIFSLVLNGFYSIALWMKSQH